MVRAFEACVCMSDLPETSNWKLLQYRVIVDLSVARCCAELPATTAMCHAPLLLCMLLQVEPNSRTHMKSSFSGWKGESIKLDGLFSGVLMWLPLHASTSLQYSLRGWMGSMTSHGCKLKHSSRAYDEKVCRHK